MRVLVVDDEVPLAQTLKEGLEAEDMTVELAHDGLVGLSRAVAAAAAGTPFDVIVLDIMLPGRNGFRVCADIRAAHVSSPILMLTAKDGELDEAEALDTGADDYLSKPFSFVVLLARLRALHRRGQSATVAPAVTGERLRVGDLVLDRAQRRAWRGDAELILTAREFDLLCELMRISPNVVSKTELLSRVWDVGYDGDPNVVEVYIGYLRRKIDVPYGRSSLMTVRGLGYRLDADG